jgi:hypothetical protein
MLIAFTLAGSAAALSPDFSPAGNFISLPAAVLSCFHASSPHLLLVSGYAQY